MYKQTNTICRPKRIRIFALIINCTTIMKTKSRFSRNVYAISDRIWCNKHLRHTTTEKYDNGKGWYFRFDDDNNMNHSQREWECLPAVSRTTSWVLMTRAVQWDCERVYHPPVLMRKPSHLLRCNDLASSLDMALSGGRPWQRTWYWWTFPSVPVIFCATLWRHDIEILSMLLALCEGNSYPVDSTTKRSAMQSSSFAVNRGC